MSRSKMVSVSFFACNSVNYLFFAHDIKYGDISSWLIWQWWILNSPIIVHKQVIFMDLQAYAQDRLIYFKWLWSKIYKK